MLTLSLWLGIRFELGMNYDVRYAYENSPYLQAVYKKAYSLFTSLHSADDDLYVVVEM